MNDCIANRIACASEALGVFVSLKGSQRQALEENIIDLIADLLHLAEDGEIDGDMVLRMAQSHFEHELVED